MSLHLCVKPVLTLQRCCFMLKHVIALNLEVKWKGCLSSILKLHWPFWNFKTLVDHKSSGSDFGGSQRRHFKQAGANRFKAVSISTGLSFQFAFSKNNNFYICNSTNLVSKILDYYSLLNHKAETAKPLHLSSLTDI